jgi:site-specific recombinase XerD
VRAVKLEMLRRAEEGVHDEPQLPGQLASAWLLEFPSANTRSAYAGDLARFFIWCSAHQVHVFDVRRHHLASYLAEAKPSGEPYAPKTQERRLAALSGYKAGPPPFSR